MQTRNKGAARRRRLLATTALLSLALLPLAPRGADAQTAWDGSSSTNWNDGTNWSTNAAPTAVDTVYILTNSPNSAEINGIAAVSSSLDINNGALSIVNAGSLVTSSFVELGFGGASASSLSLDTNSTLTANGNLIVGSSSAGTLTIAGGSGVSSLVGKIGDNAAGIGTATVTGSGSTWTTTNRLDVGYNGQGTLLIQNGGVVTAGTDVNLGYNATGVGTATVDGANSSLTAAAPWSQDTERIGQASSTRELRLDRVFSR